MANEKKDMTLKLFEGVKPAADMDYAELKAIVRAAEKVLQEQAEAKKQAKEKSAAKKEAAKEQEANG